MGFYIYLQNDFKNFNILKAFFQIYNVIKLMYFTQAHIIASSETISRCSLGNSHVWMLLNATKSLPAER